MQETLDDKSAEVPRNPVDETYQEKANLVLPSTADPDSGIIDSITYFPVQALVKLI